jgi:hypothetical protein
MDTVAEAPALSTRPKRRIQIVLGPQCLELEPPESAKAILRGRVLEPWRGGAAAPAKKLPLS